MADVDVFHGIREMVNCELMKMNQKGELDKSMLESLDKLVDILKDLDEIENGGGGYSQRRMYYDYDNGNSYRNYSRNDGYNNRGYSRHSAVDHLYKAMDQAQSESERQAIQMAIDKIMNGN